MIIQKRYTCIFMCDRERGEESKLPERQWECVRGRASVGREIALVQICINTQQKCNMINRMNGVDKVTISVRQNNTSVFLVGDF